jgi:hypothetical protein
MPDRDVHPSRYATAFGLTAAEARLMRHNVEWCRISPPFRVEHREAVERALAAGRLAEAEGVLDICDT